MITSFFFLVASGFMDPLQVNTAIRPCQGNIQDDEDDDDGVGDDWEKPFDYKEKPTENIPKSSLAFLQ